MTCVILVVGPKLIPFFVAVAVYFYFFIPYGVTGWFPASLKCLPVVCLMAFVLMTKNEVKKENHDKVRNIFFGLFFSCLGDLCLIWPDLFSLGMLFFAVAHVFYIKTFGFKPLNIPLGITYYVICLMGTIYFMPALDGILVPGVPIYAAILGTMTWRATAGYISSILTTPTYGQFFSTAGGILFGASDLVLGVNMFRVTVMHDQLITMVTYYLAQLGLSLSLIDYYKCQNEKTS